ncbi:hypothetical protein CJ030_MR7G013479 [Morella rubra]|uniref:Uncharacterized protein n=1 Tax=Morella rubra TaxID=262757 RepID=A0A6A1V239_9ROSI|nr:hypothetical protein CJ030_MR7G013479 [Morella rubra]
MAVPSYLYKELIRKGSQDQEMQIGSTTPRPPEVAKHGGAHGRLIPKDPGSHKESIDITTSQGGGAVATVVEHGGDNHHGPNLVSLTWPRFCLMRETRGQMVVSPLEVYYLGKGFLVQTWFFRTLSQFFCKVVEGL